MSKTKSVDICIATCQRPERLKRLLLSLLQQQVKPEVNYRIVVVDNDAGGSARRVVDSVRMETEIEITYSIEPERNISMARNRAIANAKGDYIVLVDDDEYAISEWLQALLDTMEHWNADVVFGPVVATYPDNTPPWIKKGGFFKRGRQPTGADTKHCASGNVLLRRTALQKMSEYFKPEFGRTGGEDTEFFFRMSKQGAIMKWCDEAVVYEPVEHDRMTVGWLARRAYWGGHNFRRVFVSEGDLGMKLKWDLRKLLFLMISLIILPGSWLAGKGAAVKVLQKFLSSIGYFSAVLKRYNYTY